MEIEKLIEDLRGILTQYGEKIPYGELVGAPWPYSRAGDLVWQDPEPYFIEQAATALSTLQDENAQLRAEVDNWKKRFVEANGKWISAENKWNGLDRAVKNGSVYAAIQEELKITQEENQSLKDVNEQMRDELEKVTAERDAAVEDLRKHRKYKCDCCYYADKQSRFPCTECQSPISTYGDGWKWRGLKKGD